MNHVLVDTSVWIDHLRSSNPVLEAMLTQGEALMHPLVLGELSMGSLANRAAFLKSAATVPDATLVMDHRVRDIVETHSWFGLGIGYIDAHLLAWTIERSSCLLWTHDRRLGDVAEQMSVRFFEPRV